VSANRTLLMKTKAKTKRKIQSHQEFDIDSVSEP
jgi:hypothetical protein